jgi:hypothetical protein
MMRFHTQKFEGIAEKAAQARALVKFLADSKIKPDYYTESLRGRRSAGWPTSNFGTTGLSLHKLHRSIKISDFAFKHFMSLLDGTRDVETLSAEMTAFRKSSVSKSQMGDSIEPGALEGNMKQGIENTLASLMRAGMLVR